VGPRDGLDGRKVSSPPGFDPGPSSPYSVAIPTELPGPLSDTYYCRSEGQILQPHTIILHIHIGPGELIRNIDSLRDGRSGDRTPVAAHNFRALSDKPWGPPSLL